MAPKKTETTEAPKKELTDIERLEALVEAQNRKIEVLERVAKGEALTLTEPEFRECRVKLLEGLPIIDWKGSELRGSDTGVQNLWIEVVTADEDGKEATAWVSALDLDRNIEVTTGKVLEEVKVPRKKQYGTVEAKAVEGYKTVALGYKVPVEVIVMESTYTVQLPDGRTFKARKLNI